MGENVQTYLVVCRAETDKLAALLIFPVIPSIELVYKFLVCLLDNNYLIIPKRCYEGAKASRSKSRGPAML